MVINTLRQQYFYVEVYCNDKKVGDDCTCITMFENETIEEFLLRLHTLATHITKKIATTAKEKDLIDKLALLSNENNPYIYDEFYLENRMKLLDSFFKEKTSYRIKKITKQDYDDYWHEIFSESRFIK